MLKGLLVTVVWNAIACYLGMDYSSGLEKAQHLLTMVPDQSDDVNATDFNHICIRLHQAILNTENLDKALHLTTVIGK